MDLCLCRTLCLTNSLLGDKPDIWSCRAVVESSIFDPYLKVRFLAAVAPHSGDWLLVLPVSSFGLRLSDETVQVQAVAVRLGCNIYVSHTCRCSASVGCMAWFISRPIAKLPGIRLSTMPLLMALPRQAYGLTRL